MPATATRTRMYTIEQLAEKLGLTQTGPDLISLFRHLHEQHDLKRTRINTVLHYGLTDTRDAMAECKQVCKDGRQHRVHGIFDPDTSKLSSAIETAAQRVARLKATYNLVTMEDMKTMSGPGNNWSNHALSHMLRNLGCNPHEPGAKPLLFTHEDARRVLDELERNASQRAKRIPSVRKARKSHTEVLEETCKNRQMVLITHIVHRAGLNSDSYRVCNRLGTKLRQRGLQVAKKLGNNGLYKPAAADKALLAAGHELVNPWPDWIK